LRRGKNPRRWKSRRAGPRALRYKWAFPPRRGFDGAAWTFSETVFGAWPSLKRIVRLATRQELASLEEPQGRTAGPALQARSSDAQHLTPGAWNLFFRP